MRLNTSGRRLLLPLINMQDCYVHHLISRCILQNLIYLHFQVPFHNIFKIQIHFTILKHSIYVGLIPNDQGQL